MHGDLRTTSLEQLCRGLDARTATGRLVITGESDEITIAFRQGRVVRAAAQGHELRLGDRLVHGGLITQADLQTALAAQNDKGLPLGEVLVNEGLVNRLVVRVFMQEQVLDALFAAVRWHTGTYSFVEDDVASTAVPTDLTVSQLLFALETRHRVWDEITRTIPSLDRVPEFVPGTDPSSAPLEPGESVILTKIDGVRSVAQITDELGFGEYEVAGVVHGLSVLGLVRLKAPSEAGLFDSFQAPAVAAPPLGQAPPAPAAPAPPAAPVFDPIGEAAAFLRGDEPDIPPAAAPDPATLAVAPEPVAPTAYLAEDSPEPAITFEIGEDSAPSVAPLIAPQPRAEPNWTEATDDESPEPWAFEIEDDADDPPRPAPRPRQPMPARSMASTAVGDANTGTPLPAPSSTPEPRPAAPAPVEPAATPNRPRSGEMTDLLRELRQLSDE